MTLRRRKYLLESMAGSVKISMGNYPSDLKDSVYDLVHRSEARQKEGREKYPYSMKMAREDLARIVRETKRNMQAMAANVQAAIKRVRNWQGSGVVVRPHYDSRTDLFGYSSMSLDPVSSSNVRLFRGSPGRFDPDLTYFGGHDVEDVLDAGDHDFFLNKPEVEADYFALVNELRRPGSTSKTGGKPIVLYTARPESDRERYERATHIPSGVFLTTSLDRAEGLTTAKPFYTIAYHARWRHKASQLGQTERANL